MAASLVEIDALDALVIIDNELDPISPAAPDTVQVTGLLPHIAMSTAPDVHDRGEATNELRMDNLCCSAHGLSILVTARKGDVEHSLLFDTGPEEKAWERNAARLRADISTIGVIQLSHWHRDHSGGMLKAIRMIQEAKKAKGLQDSRLVVDVHPSRPDYRGFIIADKIISLEADPTFADIEEAGGVVHKTSSPHTVLDDMFFISGEIPRVTTYEQGLRGAVRFNSSEAEWFSDEKIADERFLMCKLKDKGIVLFTGCSHAGVVNAAKHASNLGGSVPLHAIVGGFHLASSNEAQIESTISDLKKLDPAVLLPGHCSGWRVKFGIERHMPGTLVPCTVGVKITF